MIASIGNKQRQGGKAIDDLPARLGPSEPLEQLLKYEARRYQGVACFERAEQFANLVRCAGVVAAKGERPNARVDELRQGRMRSAL